jgi:signal transduction histidine kinase
MDKNDGQSAVQGSDCHLPVTSKRHVSGCGNGHLGKIVEAHPPERVQRKFEAKQAAVEPEFFPLVSAAHEFKTPLVVMLGYTDLLRNAQLGPVNDRQKQVLGEIQESAQRLQKLIQDLLLLGELRSSKGRGSNDAPVEAANVNDGVREIFNYWAAVAKQKSLRYEFRPAKGTPHVQVDASKLQHIVSNLIENALKFTPEGGEVKVSLTPCFWERRKAQSEFLFNIERKANVMIENAVRIDVRDTGPGIPPEHHEDIFDDFVQLPGASSRGTGLGLAIARRLMDAHGGLVWVESEPGKGSRFSLLLSQVRLGEATQ